MACSIGSKGLVWLDRIPYSIISWKGSGNDFPATTSRKSFPLKSRVTVILFCVKVPVLSVHKTVAAPRVSIAAGLRVSTCFFDIRQAPMARNMVNTTGNSSGNMAIASVIPAKKPFNKSARVNV